ncbi:hypothetical protein [Streptomyces cinnamoneus]|uniref:hypothetical protein n=1 Tax=Streptomyces cinnamoneus TaxID=53446 RepID=UPI0015E2AB4C|nr:hypothetical protein [Streptomyces cinnamoneus]
MDAVPLAGVGEVFVGVIAALSGRPSVSWFRESLPDDLVAPAVTMEAAASR